MNSKTEYNNKELQEAFLQVRAYTHQLCAPLETEDYVPQPTAEVSPVKWNIAHTTWFFEEFILKKFSPNYKPFNPHYCFLFNSYYNGVGERTPRHQRGDLSRPTVKEIFVYREYIDKKITALLQQDLGQEFVDLMLIGLNHEQQHQELLLTDLKYTLSLNPIAPVYHEDFALCARPSEIKPGYTNFSGGLKEIGHSSKGFHYDNEKSKHQVYLEDFSLSNDLVSNSDFIEFIEDGGYQNHSLWHAEGWDWVQQQQISSPLYWQHHDSQWQNFTLSGMRPITSEAPVCHVSFYEASAFAEWKGMRLPTEFEWEVAADDIKWGSRWEWTSSAYAPYPNFKAAEGAVGEYNGKFMVNQKVLRGASAATPENHSRKTYRNFFNPHLRWQFTGFRLASSQAT